VRAHDDRLVVDTTVIPTARRRVPVSFGWHPYLRLPGAPRREWVLSLPARRHLSTDARQIPTGASTPQPAERRVVGARRFDDGYRLGRDHRLRIEGGGHALEVCGDARYPYAQVWVPPGRSFLALEPMTAPTNALAAGTVPSVAPGDAFTARFTISLA